MSKNMNRPDIDQLMEEKIESLPGTVREIIFSDEIGDKVDSIGKNYDLTEDQHDSLIEEIGYVLFRVSSLASFKRNLQDNVGLVPSKALAISTELYGSIFQPVKKFLKDVDEPEQETVSIPVKQAGSVAPSSQPTSQQEAYVDTGSLSHHDILSEIENPSSSVFKSESRNGAPAAQASESDASLLPEESLVEIESESGKGAAQALASVMPTSTANSTPAEAPRNMMSTAATIAQQRINLSDSQMYSRISQNSIHHDIVPNLNGFKPIIVGNQEPITGVHLNTPVTDPLAKASDTADKLNGALSGPVTNTPTEVYVSQKPQALKMDPYREPIE